MKTLSSKWSRMVFFKLQLGRYCVVPDGRKIKLYGCGVIAPGAQGLQDFLACVRKPRPQLTPLSPTDPFFLVGQPKFDFLKYQDWISQRHSVSRFSQLQEKAGENVQFSIGAFLDALGNQPGLEGFLKDLDTRVMICLGTGFGDLKTSFDARQNYRDTLWKWEQFWADPMRNPALKDFLEHRTLEHTKGVATDTPVEPTTLPVDSWERSQSVAVWNHYWAYKNPHLQDYLKELEAIESKPLLNLKDKLNWIRKKSKEKKSLQQKWNHPTPPWEAVSPNLIWNIPNAPAAQISMLMNLHGPAYSVSGACACFGLVLKQAYDGIQSGQYDAAIVGCTDVSPTPEIVGAFYQAKVLALGTDPSSPLTHMRGTHVSGGAVVWILGDEKVFQERGLKSLGVQLQSVGISSDAEHIITPSAEGPKVAIGQAFQAAGWETSHIDVWDMHATGTPGDASEFHMLSTFFSPTARVSAYKGIFGHGMSVAGGWELTAQTLGPYQREGHKGRHLVVPGLGIAPQDLNSALDKTRILAGDDAHYAPEQKTLKCAKMCMGVGGISTCVLTQVEPEREHTV